MEKDWIFKTDEHSSVQMNHKGIQFSVEYATELLGVISILCSDQYAICDAGEECCNAEYRNEVLSFFGAWKGSEVTRLLERLSDDYNFNFDAPVDLFLQLKHGVTPDLEVLCRHRKPVPPELFAHFLDLVEQFEAESGFGDFFEEHRAYYETILHRFIADYDEYCPLDFLTEYLGAAPENRYHVNMMLGITNSNYGVTVGNDLYANLCPNHKSRFGQMPDFSYAPVYWTTLIVHEFAHSFVNPVSARHSSQIGEKDLAPYRDILREMMYGDSLETYINETIIRAIECLYVRKHFPAHHEAYVSDYVDEGFVKIREVEELLQDMNGTSLEADYEKLLNMF